MFPRPSGAGDTAGAALSSQGSSGTQAKHAPDSLEASANQERSLIDNKTTDPAYELNEDWLTTNHPF